MEESDIRGKGESEEEKEESDIKKRRQLPEISEKAWHGVNEIRKQYKITWQELFERINNYQDWFDLLLRLRKEPSLGDKLNAVTVMHYMPMWLENIYKNFFKEHIKDLSDIKKIAGTAKGKPAIAIGAGPSLFKYKHLELLAQSQFYQQKVGPILTTSHTVKDCLEAGVIPDYMILLDPEPIMMTHIDHDIVDKYADQITGVFCITTDHEVYKRWKGKKVFFISAISEATIPNVMAIISGLFPEITEMNALANAGSFSWNVARFMGCNPIVLIGMDQGFLPETPFEETPYYNAFKRSHSTHQEIVDDCFHFHTHSFFKNNSYTDDIYKNFAANTIEIARITKEQEGVETLNCTGGGFIDKPEIIENMWFEDFLEKWEKKGKRKEGRSEK